MLECLLEGVEDHFQPDVHHRAQLHPICNHNYTVSFPYSSLHRGNSTSQEEVTWHQVDEVQFVARLLSIEVAQQHLLGPSILADLHRRPSSYPHLCHPDHARVCPQPVEILLVEHGLPPAVTHTSSSTCVRNQKTRTATDYNAHRQSLRAKQLLCHHDSTAEQGWDQIDLQVGLQRDESHLQQQQG